MSVYLCLLLDYHHLLCWHPSISLQITHIVPLLRVCRVCAELPHLMHVFIMLHVGASPLYVLHSFICEEKCLQMQV